MSLMLKPWKRCLSDYEEEEEQLGPDDDDEVTGKQRKEKYEYDAAMKQRLVEFYAENYCFYNKDVKALLPPCKLFHKFSSRCDSRTHSFRE